MTATAEHQQQPAERQNAIRISGLRKTYGEGDVAVHALQGVDLVVFRGEFVVILGPSGSGKTTLINIVGGIESPSDGTITVAGEEISRLDRKGLTAYRRNHIGFVFQFYNLIPTLTALENVQLIAELVEGDAGKASQKALEAVGLGERSDHFPSALSGGQQQRVAIARALVKQPDLMLCDEPTGALDLERGVQVLSLLHRISREQQSTVMLVTHNSAISQMADRVIRIVDGQVVDNIVAETPLPPEEIKW